MHIHTIITVYNPATQARSPRNYTERVSSDLYNLITRIIFVRRVLKPNRVLLLRYSSELIELTRRRPSEHYTNRGKQAPKQTSQVSTSTVNCQRRIVCTVECHPILPQ